MNMNPKEIQAGNAAIKAGIDTVKKYGEATKTTTAQIDGYLRSVIRVNKVNSVLAGAMSALKKRAMEASEKLGKSEDQNNKYSESLLKAKKRIDKLSDRMVNYYIKVKKAEKANKISTKAYELSSRRLKSTTEDLKVAESQYKGLTASIVENRKGMEKFKNIAEESAQAIKNLSSKEYIEYGKEFNDEMQKRIDGMRKYLDIMVEDNKISRERADAEMDEFSSWESRETMRQKMMKYSTEQEKEQLDAYEEMKRLKEVQEKFPGVGAGRAREKMAGTGGEVRGKVGGIFAAKGFKGIYGAAKGMTESVEKFKAMREGIAGAAKGASGLTGTMKALGAAFGIIGKMNWVALIISAVVGLAKAVNEMNKFITQYNKSFAKMYGPTVMIKNVRASMKEFTDAVFDMNRNLKYGLKSEDIMGLFEAMSQGGLSLAGVGKRVAGGYNEVIDQAIKLSRDFGVSMEEAGKMMSDQMLELRMSLKDVDDAFKTITYDAAISGIKSERFYESVSAATMALGMYGKYLDDASALLREFYKTGALGYKDASQQAEDMMGMFKGMSDSQRMAMIAMTGGGARWKKVFEDKAKDIQTAAEAQEKVVKDLREQAKTATGEAKADIMKRIGAEEDALKKQRANLIMLQKAAAGGETAMASALAYLSEEGPGVVLDVLKNIGQNIYDPKQWFVIKNFLMNTMKMSQEGAERFIATMQAGEAGLEKAAKDYINTTSSIPDTNRKKIAKLISDQIATGTVDISKLKKDLVEQHLMLSEDVDAFGDQVADNADVMEKILREGKVTSSELEKMYADRIKKPFKVSINMEAEAASKRMDDLIKNTTSIEDYLGIGKENLEYMRAMLAGGDIQAATATAAMETARTAGAILGWVQRIATGKKGMTDSEFKNSKQWEKILDLTRYQVELQDQLTDPHSKINKLDKKQKEIARKQMQDEINKIEELRKDQLKGYEYLLPDAMTKVQQEERRKGELVAAAEDYKATPEERAEAQKEKEKRDKQTEISAEKAKKALAHKEYWRKIGSKVVPELYPSEPEKDYVTEKKGYQYLQKGDLVIDSKKVAQGLSGDRGEFINKLGGFPDSGNGAQEMGRLTDAVILKMSRMKVQTQPVNVPLSVSIGTINGDADDMLKKIGPAIEQTFNRMFFEKQKRGV